MRRGILLILAGLIWLVNSSRAATDDAFAQGLTAAQAGDFSSAVEDFEKSIGQKPSSGALVNLGVSEWRRGHAGAAILAWERAQWIDPFDEAARENLKFARMAAQVDEPQLKWFEQASTWLPPNWWVWLAGAGLWTAIGALVLPGFLRRRKAGWQQWLAALGLGIFLFCITANIGVVSRMDLGFTLKKGTPLLLTPTRTSEVITTLAAGEPARRLKSRGDYCFVQTSFGAGWIEQKNLGLINQPW